MKIRFDIEECQWMSVILFTAMACAFSESLLGLVMLPFWWGIAVIFRNVP